MKNNIMTLLCSAMIILCMLGFCNFSYATEINQFVDFGTTAVYKDIKINDSISQVVGGNTAESKYDVGAIQKIELKSSAKVNIALAPRSITDATNKCVVGKMNLVVLNSPDSRSEPLIELSKDYIPNSSSCAYQTSVFLEAGTYYLCFYVEKQENSNPLIYKANIGAWYSEEVGRPSVHAIQLYKYNALKLEWNVSTRYSGVDAYYKESLGTIWEKVNGSPQPVLCSGLKAGTKYDVYFQQYHTINGKRYYGLPSEIKSIYTLKKVANNKIGKYSKDKVKVSWSNMQGETGYQISKSTKNGVTSIVATVTSPIAKNKIIKATKGKKYYYKVRAYKKESENGFITKVYGPWSSAIAYRLK